MGGAIIIPLVAILFPILLIILAIAFDALLMSWALYRVWRARAHGRLWRLLHRSP
jgi:hypothetical protein